MKSNDMMEYQADKRRSKLTIYSNVQIYYSYYNTIVLAIIIQYNKHDTIWLLPEVVYHCYTRGGLRLYILKAELNNEVMKHKESDTKSDHYRNLTH